MKLFHIDAFTDELFKGNPAAVCWVEEPLTDGYMQHLATEMNLSETAFVTKTDNGFSLRWFTPAREVPLCGHATLASAFVLFETGKVNKEEVITFHTLSGLLHVRYQASGALMMDFPSQKPQKNNQANLSTYEGILGCAVAEILDVPNELLLVIKNAEDLRSLNPPSDVLSKWAENGVMVTAWDGKDRVDFVSRYFAPNLGIKEDPVTGFMHTILTPYWAEKKGGNKFSAFQASQRGGYMRLSLVGDRVQIEGKAIKVYETDVPVINV